MLQPSGTSEKHSQRELCALGNAVSSCHHHVLVRALEKKLRNGTSWRYLCKCAHSHGMRNNFMKAPTLMQLVEGTVVASKRSSSALCASKRARDSARAPCQADIMSSRVSRRELVRAHAGAVDEDVERPPAAQTRSYDATRTLDACDSGLPDLDACSVEYLVRFAAPEPVAATR